MERGIGTLFILFKRLKPLALILSFPSSVQKCGISWNFIEENNSFTSLICYKKKEHLYFSGKGFLWYAPMILIEREGWQKQCFHVKARNLLQIHSEPYKLNVLFTYY